MIRSGEAAAFFFGRRAHGARFRPDRRQKEKTEPLRRAPENAPGPFSGRFRGECPDGNASLSGKGVVGGSASKPPFRAVTAVCASALEQGACGAEIPKGRVPWVGCWGETPAEGFLAGYASPFPKTPQG